LLSVRPFVALLPPANGRYAVSSVVTDEATFVARSLAQSERVGTLGSKYLRAAVAGRRSSGTYRGFTLEGFANFTAFARSPLTGWSAHLALGSAAVDSPTRRFLGSLGAAAVLSLLLALALVAFALRQLAAGRRAAERGQQAQKLEALGQLTGGIAHDFNNLLTPIVGALDFLLKRTTLDERAQRIANGALASAHRAGKLTAQLLTFSRRQKLDIESVDVAALLGDMRPLLDQAAGKDHAVEIRIAGERLWARSDLNQLELAVLNLVINARDATPGGGTIVVDAARDHEAGHERIILSVIDTGQGMTAEVRRRALEPFFTTKPGGRGTGLGLAQVFGVMQQSGGELKIHSRPGEGTTIVLALPASADQPSSLQRPSPDIVAAAEAVARQLFILIVDDDAAVRSVIARSFEDDGHVVDSVGDARIALSAIEYCDYDLAIVDFAMPNMDGAALIRAARKLRPGQKFLMITGYSDSEAVTAACPDTPVIRKPFDGDALRRRVFELVSQGL
jgi:signal transduction histidine kinase/CheY-like chemotaxis protein